ncbi:hypothetical protein pdam_00019626 [Pocillopora damicornis]|uniref:Uncharacterized protein n=1 Tax=Pocillopora damicornis TaxID=46731 RepID=A0A3M6TKP0_POCDA|nr:hypothetical protein pdam_00019626 [Pocillopora damicornis]
MSSKRVKQKETVEEDFEAFVRHQLSSIMDLHEENSEHTTIKTGTTRFFIVSTTVVSVLVITGNVPVQLSYLTKRRGPPRANNSLMISRATKSLKEV